MSASTRADQLWQPANFQERGVAVPFTTPILAGTRLRRAARGLELVVPHPAGVRGVYIMACSELPHFCAATLHDLQVAARIAGLATVTPRSVRQVARAVALQGAAGRAARAAALAAAETDRQDRLAANIHLLQMLVRQTTGAICAPAALDRQAKVALLGLAPTLRRPAATLTTDIEALADAFAGIVLAAQPPSRCQAQLAAMEQLLGHLAEAEPASNDRAAAALQLLRGAAKAALALGRAMLAEAEALLHDVAALLAAWARNTDAVNTAIGRAEWLLDGWAEICLTWSESSLVARRGALAEMALRLPVLPADLAQGTGLAAEEAARQRLRAGVLGGEDWRTGAAMFDLVARNERLLALAA